MDLKLKDKVFMVAAGSKGLGFGIAKALLEEGAYVSIGSRSQSNIDKAINELSNISTTHIMGHTLDASNSDSIKSWTDASTQKFRGLDGLVVNAGGPPVGQFDDFSDDDWQEAFELTLMSSVRMIRCALPHLRKRKGGAILTLTSSSVKEPIDILLLSNVMRSGVTSLAKSLSKQLASEHIRINNLIPGRMDTDRVRS
ncbi:MAG: SDR family NAD(P)-dependent oxidoreductase, partial [Planctomycetes bacterium]|nr:SDR family NAD(P)-dependent oxidoreductase [Planctomycetota bacterium]